MPSSRVISSEIFSDVWFGSLNDFECLVWIGLFSNCADSQGRILDNTALIRANLFPYRDVALCDIEQLLVRAADNLKVYRYEIKGEHYVQILRWWEYQYPRFAGESRFPPPPGWTDHINTTVRGEKINDNWTTTSQHIEIENAYIEMLESGDEPVTQPDTDSVTAPVTDIRHREPSQTSVTALPVSVTDSVPNSVSVSVPDSPPLPSRLPSQPAPARVPDEAKPAQAKPNEPLKPFAFRKPENIPNEEMTSDKRERLADQISTACHTWREIVKPSALQPDDIATIGLLVRQHKLDSVLNAMIEYRLNGGKANQINRIQAALMGVELPQLADAEIEY